MAPHDADLIWRPRPVMPSQWGAIGRGLRNRCPVCGQQPLFAGYLRVAHQCRQCRATLDKVPADDAPPYFTILLVGHIVVPLLLLVERAYTPPLWLEAAIFLPLTTLLSLGLLRPIKGAVLGWLLFQHYARDRRHG